MADLADLFGFAEWISTRGGRILRVGGKGPPLLLLHGYPQTHVMCGIASRRCWRRSFS